MGLDQHMMKRIQNAEGEGDTIEIAYWRKVRHVQNWMEEKWHEEGNSGEFNCVELTMTPELLNELEETIANGDMSKYDGSGFFFGDNFFEKEDEQYLLTTISECRKAISIGYHVYYHSWW